MIKLGVARKYGKDMVKYFDRLSEEKVEAYEMGFAYGIPTPFPIEFLQAAKEKNIALSGHLPFWINLGNLDNKEKNIKYLIEGVKIAEELRSTIVFHLGFYGKHDYACVKNNIISCFHEVLEQTELKNGRIGIETTGKQKAIGTINEIVDIVNELDNKNIVPVIDWSHIYARSNGQHANSYESFISILSEIENKCKFKLDYFHGGSVLHEGGNEKKHISSKNLSPSMPDLLEALNSKGYNDYTLIIESPDSINDVHWLKNKRGVSSMFKFDHKKQYFLFEGEQVTVPDYPLTVTLQINRKCNLSCIYCSEYEMLDDLSYEDAVNFVEKLKGVNRIIISGGEPLLHKELVPILKLCRKEFDVVALATNAVLMTPDLAAELVKYVDYFDLTIDGPREIHNSIRGNYDGIIQGIINIKNAGGAFSIVTVLFDKNRDVINYIATISDTLGAEKLKILSPIPKGKGVSVVSGRLNLEEANKVFEDLRILKDKFGLRTKIVMTDWDMIKEGHAILIHPDGKVVASPVWSKEACVDVIGNIHELDIKDLWDRYPYKINHINKYIEKTMKVY